MAEDTGLTDAQKERIQRVTSEIQVDKVTVSFSIEGRGLDGMKKSAFNSMTSSCRSEEDPDRGWSVADANLARLVLCKQVVKATYEDAVRRGIMLRDSALSEASNVLSSYDKAIQKALQSES